jgi:hypothetical protein
LSWRPRTSDEPSPKMGKNPRPRIIKDKKIYRVKRQKVRRSRWKGFKETLDLDKKKYA